LFVGSLISEEDVSLGFDLLSFDDSNVSKKKEQPTKTLISLISKYSMFHFCTPLVKVFFLFLTFSKPSMVEIIEGDLVSMIILDDKMKDQDMIQTLNQFPFENLKKFDISKENIEKFIFQPISIALEKYSYNEHLPLLLHLTKICVVNKTKFTYKMCCEQYPDLSFKSLEMYLKGKWPSRLYGLNFIYLFSNPFIDIVSVG
jgi:hypothetical protein